MANASDERAKRTGQQVVQDQRITTHADKRPPLQGRIALVTGCGSPQGIGFATARTVAEHGAGVAITSTTARINDRAAELAAAGHEVGAFVVDLTFMDQAASLVQSVTDRFGGIDVLVNNAGAAQAGM